MTMKTQVLRALALSILVAGVTVPASALAVTTTSTQAVHENFNTTISPLWGFGAPWSGTLQLTVTPDDIINGYYRPADTGAFVPVTGGRNGDEVWFDIGARGRTHVQGTLHNGTIVGTAHEDGSVDSYKFVASLAR